MEENIKKEFTFQISNDLTKDKKQGTATMNSSILFTRLTNKKNTTNIIIDFPKLVLSMTHQKNQEHDEITTLLAIYDIMSQVLRIKQNESLWLEFSAKSIFTNLANLVKNPNLKVLKNKNFYGKKFENFQEIFSSLENIIDEDEELKYGHLLFAAIRFLIFEIFKSKEDDQSEIEEMFDCFPKNAMKRSKEFKDFLRISKMSQKLKFIFKFADQLKPPTNSPNFFGQGSNINLQQGNINLLRKSQSLRQPMAITNQPIFGAQNHRSTIQTNQNQNMSQQTPVLQNYQSSSQTASRGFQSSFNPQTQSMSPNQNKIGFQTSFNNVSNPQSMGGVNYHPTGLGTNFQRSQSTRNVSSTGFGTQSVKSLPSLNNSNPFGNPFGETEIEEIEPSMKQMEICGLKNQAPSMKKKPVEESNPFAEGFEESNPFGGVQTPTLAPQVTDINQFLQDDTHNVPPSSRIPKQLNLQTQNQQKIESNPFNPFFEEEEEKNELKVTQNENDITSQNIGETQSQGQFSHSQNSYSQKIGDDEDISKYLVQNEDKKEEKSKANIIPINEKVESENESSGEEMSENKPSGFNLKPAPIPAEKTSGNKNFPSLGSAYGKNAAKLTQKQGKSISTTKKKRNLRPIRITCSIDYSHPEIGQKFSIFLTKENIMQRIQNFDNFNMKEEITDIHYRFEHEYTLADRNIKKNDRRTIEHLNLQITLIKNFNLNVINYSAILYLVLIENENFDKRFPQWKIQRLILQVIKMLSNIAEFKNHLERKFYDINQVCLMIGIMGLDNNNRLQNFMRFICGEIFPNIQPNIDFNCFTKERNITFTLTPKYMIYIYEKLLTKNSLTISEFQGFLKNFDENNINDDKEDPEQTFLRDIIFKHIYRYENSFEYESEINLCLRLMSYYYQTTKEHFDSRFEKEILNKLTNSRSSFDRYLSDLEISLFLVKQEYISSEGKDRILKNLLTSIKKKGKKKNKGFFKKISGWLFGNEKTKIPKALKEYIGNQLKEFVNQTYLIYQKDSATFEIVKNLMEEKENKKNRAHKEKVRDALQVFQTKIEGLELTFEELERLSSMKTRNDFTQVQGQILSWCGNGNKKERKKINENLANRFFQMKKGIKKFVNDIEHFEKSLSTAEINESIDLNNIRMKISQMKKNSVTYLKRREFVEEIEREYDSFNLCNQMVNESKFVKCIIQAALKKQDWDKIEDLVMKKFNPHIKGKSLLISKEMSIGTSGLSSSQNITNPFLNSNQEVNPFDINFSMKPKEMNDILSQTAKTEFGSIVDSSQISESKMSELEGEDRDFDMLDPNNIGKKPMKVSFERGKNILEKVIRELKDFFERNGEDLPRALYYSIEDFIRNKKQYEEVARTVEAEEKSIKMFSYNISLLQILESSEHFLSTIEQMKKYLKLNFSKKKDDQLFFKFIKQIVKYSKDPEISSKRLKKFNDKKVDLIQYLLEVSSNLKLFNKLTSILEVYSYFRKVGDVHINEIENEGDPDKYSLTNSDISRLKKIKKLMDNALIEQEQNGFQGFCKILKEKSTKSKLQKKYFNYIDLLAKKADELMKLSKDYLNQDVSGKDKLKVLMEKSSFIFDLLKSGNEIYKIRAQVKFDRGKMKEYDDQSLEELRVKLSIASFSAVNTEDEEVKTLINKRECFLKIYATTLNIKSMVEKIYESGYIYNLEQAMKKKYGQKSKKIVHPFKFNKENKFGFEIKIRKFDKEKIIKHFELFLDCLIEIEEEVNKNALALLTSEKHYWLTFLTGAQYKQIIQYISRESSHSDESNIKDEIFNIMKYCFGERKAKEILRDDIVENSITPSEIHEFNTLKILDEIKIGEEKGIKNKKNQEVLKSKDTEKISFLGYEFKKYAYILRMFAVSNLEIKSPNRFLFCNRNTKKYEIHSFLQKSLFNSKNDLFVCVDIDLLMRENFNFFLSSLRKIISNLRNRQGENLFNPFDEETEESSAGNTSINLNIMIIVKSMTKNNYREEIQKFNLIEPYPINILEYDENKDENELKSNNFNRLIPEGVFIYESAFSGLGKTYQIKKRAESKKSNLLTLFLAGDLNPKNLDDRLIALRNDITRLGDKKMELHIKLDVMEGYEQNIQLMDQILFQIIYLKCIPLQNTFLFFHEFKGFYIEIGNTFKNVLNRGLSFLQIFREDRERESLISIDEPSIEEIDLEVLERANFRFVTNYLWLLDNRAIEQTTYEHYATSVNGEMMLAQIDKNLRLRLLMDHYIDHRRRLTLEKSSYSQIINFVKILSSQFQKFNQLPHFFPQILTDLQIGFSIRPMVIEKIISLAKQYSWSTTNIIREHQIANKKLLKTLKKRGKNRTQVSVKNAIEKEIQNYQNIISKLPKWEQWDETKNSTLYFGNGCMKPIYKNPERLPENIKKIVKTNSFGMENIPDYRNYSDSNFIQEIGQALNKGTDDQIESLKKRTKNFQNKGYVITMDNYIKILLICQRAEEGIPIILQGETGCGKTFMINYISSCLLEEEFRCFTLHSGISEEEFTGRLCEYVKIARGLQGKKRLWVLLDEFNTSPLQALLAEVMVERNCTFSPILKDIPDNIVFVACCNPYRKKSSSKTKGVGLVHESSKSDLSHKVFPIPDSLINYVWDFGQLSPTAEEKYIDAIISSNAKGFYKYLAKSRYKDSIRLSITTAQNFIRDIENDSSVSLRDVQRFIRLFKFLHGERNEGLLIEQNKGHFYKHLNALSLAITMCYLLRIGNKRSRAELSQKIERKLKGALKIKGRNFEIQEIFDREATQIANQALELGCIPDDISLNKPLKENLFVCLCCVELQIPVLMCGKPGTSKTVSIEILKAILSSTLRGSKRKLKRFSPCSMDQFWGSLNTTAESIQKLFDKAKAEYKRNPNQNRAIIFDEVGLAEIAPDNPLKVLHPLLDPSSEDESERYKTLVEEIKKKLEKEKKQENELYGDMNERDTEPTTRNRKIDEIGNHVGFIGISNWRLDVSKMNRILFVSRPDMDEDDLRDTCETIFESTARRIQFYEKVNNSYIEKHKESLKKMWGIIAHIYFKFREFEMKNRGHQNFHGSRDFYSLVKYIIDKLRPEIFKEKSDVDNFEIHLSAIVAAGIERNFSGKEIEDQRKYISASVKVKELFKDKMIKEDYRFSPKILNSSTPVFQLIRENLVSEKSRHLMIFTDGAYLDNIIVDQIKAFKRKEQLNQNIMEESPDSKVVYFMRSEGKDDVFDITTKLPQYIEEDYTVIMKDLDDVYGCLYDLLNQKYKNIDGQDYCNIFYDDHKKQFKVNKKFRIVLLMQREDSMGKLGGKKQPAPFLNRFEKHLVKYDSLMDEETKTNLFNFKKVVEENMKSIYKINKKKTFPKHLMIHNYSEELLVSLVCEENKSKFLDGAALVGYEKEDHFKGKLNLLNQSNSRGRYRKVKEKNSFDNKKFKELSDKMIRMFSRNAILCFMNNFKKKNTTDEALKKEKKLVNKFLKRHKINSLLEFLPKFEKAKISRAIIFTYTYAYELENIIEGYDSKNSVLLLTASQINREGASSKIKSIKNYFEKQNIKTIIIQFEKRKDWNYIEYIKSIVDDVLAEKDENEEVKYGDKKVLFIAQYSAEDYIDSHEIKTSINFMTNDWIMLVIDDLENSDYKKFFELMGMNIGDFLNSEGINEDLLKKLINEKFVEIYNEDIKTSEDREFFMEIIEFIKDNEEFFDKIISAVKKIQGGRSIDEKRVYEHVLEKGMLKKLSMDYKDTLKSVLDEVYGESLSLCLLDVHKEFRFMDRIIFEKFSKKSNDMKLMKKNWDKKFGEYQIEDKNINKLKKKSLRKRKKNLSLLSFSISSIARYFALVNEELRKISDFKNLLEVKDEEQNLKEKMKKIEAMTRKAIKSVDLKEKEVFVDSKESEGVQELNQIEIISQIFGNVLFSYSDHKVIRNFVNSILSKNDALLHEDDDFTFTEMEEEEKEEIDLETFIAFCHLYKHDIVVLANITKSSKRLDLTSKETLKKFTNDYKAGKHFGVDSLIGNNLSTFIDFGLKTELKENIKILYTLKEEYSDDKNHHFDIEFVKILEILLILLRFSLKIRTNKQLRGLKLKKKKIDNLLNSISNLAKKKEEMVSNEEMGLTNMISLGEVMKQINEYEDISKLDIELLSELNHLFVEILLENDKEEKELSEETVYESVRFLLRSVFELKISSLRTDYFFKLLANSIENNLDFDWERSYDVMRNSLLAKEFEKLFEFQQSNNHKVKFCMMLSDSILRNFVDLKLGKNLHEENEEMTENSFMSMRRFGNNENDDIMRDILLKIGHEKIHVDEIKNGRLLEFLTRVSMFRYVFTRKEDEINCFSEIDNIVDSYYKKSHTQPLALYAIQRITNTIGEAGIKNQHMNKIRAIKEELYQNNENKFVIPQEEIFNEMGNIRKIVREIDGGEQLSYDHQDGTDKRLAILQSYIDVALYQERENKEEIMRIMKNMISKKDNFIPDFFEKLKTRMVNSFPDNFLGVDNGNEILLSVIVNFFIILEISKDFAWDYQGGFIRKNISSIRFLMKKPPDHYSTYLDLSRNTRLGTKIWQCECGYPFVVADCGALNQRGKCPDCRKDIGGIGGHRPVPGTKQKSLGSLSDLNKKVNEMRQKLNNGYKDHNADDLRWGLPTYPELRNYSTVIFSHMFTELLLLYRNLKQKNKPKKYKKHLEKIFNDFELLRRELAKDHLSIGYLLSGLHFRMYQRLRSQPQFSLANFLTNEISNELSNPNRFIVNYNRQRNQILQLQTSNNEVIRNLIARAVTLKDLEQIFNKKDILLMRFLRDFKEFNDADFDKYVSKGKKKYLFIDTLQTNFQLFRRFKSCLLPLIKIALYLSNNYALMITKQEAFETDMEKFIDSKNDRKLKNYYDQAKRVFEDEDKLPYLINNYDNLLKFNIGCETVDDLVKDITRENAKVITFMLTNGRSDEEVFMSVIINALIKLQNQMISNVNNIDIFKEVNSKGKKYTEIFDWESLNKNQKIENVKIDIRYLKEEHVLHLDKSNLDLLKNTSTLSTEFLRENEFIAHLDDIKNICAKNFFEGKRKIKMTQEMMTKNFFKFKGGEEQPLNDLADNYLENFAQIQENQRGKIKKGLKKLIQEADKIEQIMKIENLLRKVIFELENNYVVDKEKIALSILDKKFIDIYGIKSAQKSMLMKVKVFQLKSLTDSLMVKKGQITYPKVKKILEKEGKRKNNDLIKRYKSAIKKQLNTQKKSRSFLNELYKGILQIDTEPKIAERKNYELIYFPDDFECLISKYKIIEAMKMRKKEKLTLKDLVWMIEILISEGV